MSETDHDPIEVKTNGRRFADDIFECTLFDDNFSISYKMLLKYVPYDVTDNNPLSEQIMVWRV